MWSSLRVWVMCAVAACGRIGFDPTSDMPPPGGIDLEVPIEMFSSVAPASDLAPVDFDRTRTFLRTSDYDGDVTYAFEIVANNQEPGPLMVELIDRGMSAVVATIVVAPDGTPTRYRVPFTPVSDNSVYSIRLPGTSTTFQFAVFAARLIVHQVGATRTRLYIPLLCSDAQITGNTNLDINGAADTVVSDTYAQVNSERYDLWRKDTSSFSTIPAGTPWTFEVMMFGEAPTPHVAFASLFDVTSGQQVAATETVTTDNTRTNYLRTDFANDASGFVEGDTFEVRVRGDEASYNAYLFKAGLWLTLDPLVRGEVTYRVGGQRNGPAVLDEGRSLVDLAAFSNPVTSFDAVAIDGNAALLRVPSDNGTAGATLVPGAALSFTATKQLRRSSTVDLGAGNFLATTTGGSVVSTRSSVVVGFGP